MRYAEFTSRDGKTGGKLIASARSRERPSSGGTNGREDGPNSHTRPRRGRERGQHMGEVASIELLENTHQFPCRFMFKAIGRAENGFVGRVVAAVRDELAHELDPPYSFRQASGGR